MKDFQNLSHLKPSKTDTVKPAETYVGYRLHLTEIKLIKKTDNWVRIQFTAINTGRNDINFSKKGTEHWVQFNFDNSLYESKLGGMKDQIRYAFYKTGFKLKAGKTVKDAQIKAETFTPIIAQNTEDVKSENNQNSESEHKIIFTGGGKDVTETDLKQSKIQCPDLVIDSIKVLDETKNRLTLEYYLKNIGEGPVDLVERVGGDRIKLAVRAHISGVPNLTKGALSIGGGSVGNEINEKDITLYPGDMHKEILKLDIRRKTRYMKTIILSLDSHELPYECDRTNNTKAIELE